MDLHLQGKSALVCGSSKGLGYACAMSLAREGVSVTLVARTAQLLEKSAETIRQATGAKVTTVAADITTPEGREQAFSVAGMPDILVTNAGGPKPGDFRDWSKDDWMAALNANMYTPIALIQHVIDSMINQRYGRIVNITSAAVKMPIDILGLSNGARSGLTGFVAGLARQVVEHNVTINNLLPGPFETDRLKETAAKTAQNTGKPIEEIMQARLKSIPAKRYGQPYELGDACAFLCSAQAGFITGQNLVLDGGIYPGML
ncbi:3-oxoacyl-ACP reductase [Pollutimonas nitritireducens]|uniref:3-oxoacyl-ACP reductase n=1 Tax=Pollutimonas nitritireducens TaxID=2045209 RepID=A0A2N4ULM4_9BURK|nr:SDR family oxidoreductase [Pollutimonas nitritireducens]PLC55924.1 3-oxoacyl-ACP reductase [Pollutimonas nitritireducens]